MSRPNPRSETLDLLDLPVLEVDRCRAPEDGHDDPHGTLRRESLVDHAVEVLEGAFLDLDAIASAEVDFDLRGLFLDLERVEDLLDLGLGEGNGLLV